MTEQVIPVEAVEAAWVRFQYLTITRDEIRGILEAAAPHMLAAARDSDAILNILEAAGVEKTQQFDALVAIQKLTTP